MNDKVEALLSQMTLQEKVGQMTQLTVDMVCEGEAYKVKEPRKIVPEKLEAVIGTHQVGSILNVGASAASLENWHEIIGAIQERASENRLKIPVLYGIDAIHGTNYTQGSTLYPQQLALASTWNLAKVEELAQITAYETRASAIPWNFSPVLDLGRNALWPRIWETFGEDVHLSTQMGLAMLKGFQGEDIGDDFRVAACLKHYTGYGMPITGRDRTPAWIPERQLREYYLPAFQAAIAAGAATIMINSGEVNGVPVHASHFLLTEVLRNELGFKGVAVTDWEDIHYLYTRHRVADSYKEAIRLAIEAGVDMSMVPTDLEFPVLLRELVEEGQLSESRIDESVRRILQLKMDLGLFEKSYQAISHFPDFACEAFRQKNRQAAQESIILLKNDSILPLAKETRLLVCGPTADSLRSLNGGWTYTWQGEQTDQYKDQYATVYQALKQRLGAHLTYVPGSTFEAPIDVQAAVEAANGVEAILLCLGEASYTEFPGNIADLDLPKAQQELATALLATGKPVILLCLQGRPRIITDIASQAKAVLTAFYPGNEGGQAIADVLLGEVSPSAKLPITYPRASNALENYDHKHSEVEGIQGMPPAYKPLYEFGHGLTYTAFVYSDLALSQEKIKEEERLDIHVKLQNTGDRTAKEVVLLYISDLYASISPPVRRLRRFEKVELAAGETRDLVFHIQIKDLAFVGYDLKWQTEKGRFKVAIGGLEKEFEYI
ncbi:MAG: glycoside hydrolase family 3 N-terminal domain-containing protein [Bacteroidota bacterium]